MYLLRKSACFAAFVLLAAVSPAARAQGNLDLTLSGNSAELTSAGGSFDITAALIAYSNDTGNSAVLNGYSVSQIGGPDPTLLGGALQEDPTGYFTNFDGQSILSGTALGPGLLDSYTLSAGATPGVYTLDVTIDGLAAGSVFTQPNEGLFTLTIDAPVSDVPEGVTPLSLFGLFAGGVVLLGRRKIQCQWSPDNAGF